MYRKGENEFRETRKPEMVAALDALKRAEAALCDAHISREAGLNREVDLVGEAIRSLLKRKG